jgi:hypothetical protein
MRAVPVVIPPPLLRLFPGILQTHKPVLIQTLQPEPGVERLDIGVVRGLAGTAEVKFDVIPVSPEIDILGDELRAVVNLNRSRLSMFFGNPFENLGDLHTPDPLGHMDGQALTGMVVH